MTINWINFQWILLIYAIMRAILGILMGAGRVEKPKRKIFDENDVLMGLFNLLIIIYFVFL